LPAEIALLDQARGAVAAGEPARALAILDGYTVRFPRGAMAPEATVLRIEALVKAGDRPAATRFADAFLATAPTSPYTTRIQSLLTTANP
jgi:outer membrane protein assembly factor BamD (BamD/ComL family)